MGGREGAVHDWLPRARSRGNAAWIGDEMAAVLVSRLGAESPFIPPGWSCVWWQAAQSNNVPENRANRSHVAIVYLAYPGHGVTTTSRCASSCPAGRLRHPSPHLLISLCAVASPLPRPDVWP